MQSPDACLCPVDDANKFGTEFRHTVFEQALLRSFNGKPGGVSLRLLRRFQARHFAKVGSDGKPGLVRSASSRPCVFWSSCRVAFAPEVSGKGDCFHPPMNASLFKSLKRSRLGVSKAAFNAAFRKNPASTPSLHQQEFNASFAHAIANGGNLLPSFRKR